MELLFFHLQRGAFWTGLHLQSGLLDWDMASELGLGATGPSSSSDPGPPPQGTEVKPHLWMWVNPNEVCPIPGRVSSAAEAPPSPGEEAPLADPQAPPPEDPIAPVDSQAQKASCGVAPEGPPKAPMGSDGPALKPRKPKAFRWHGRRLKRAHGEWPRPPLNYCILISLALRSSADSSLTVQEIYQFTRQHFPFFRTAPEGWKNTVRHNLCFSSSFEKTTDFVCLEGNRKSRLWRLTAEGRRRFQEEAQALPRDTMGLVHQSMDRPELLRPLFGL